jgi:hypothetical protein
MNYHDYLDACSRFSCTNEGYCIRPTMHHTELNDFMLRNPNTRAS